MTHPTIILGSQSPRRKEILNFFTLPFKQISPDFDESSVPFMGDPENYVKLISDGKAASLISLYPDQIILTADTIVYKDGKVYGKPKDEQELKQFLYELNGNWHTVFTSLTLTHAQNSYQKVEATRVLFNKMTNDQIESYGKKLPWRDKAGGYMAQLAGSLVVRKIDGCFYNVIGLPINTLELLLKEVNINLWDYLGPELLHKD